MAKKAAEKVQSVRLTEDMRRDITRALISNALDKRTAAHQAASYKLALRIYNTRYTSGERKRMSEAPKGWLPEETCISVALGGERHSFSFGPYDQKNQTTHRVPSIHAARRYYEAEPWAVDPRSEIGAAIRAHIDAGEKLVVEHKELKAKADAVLSGVTTTTRLAEVWPEAVPFIPKYVPRQLPAVRRDELNAAFGLRTAAA